ncbi:MAG TPA: radical SAM protein [Candidatus Eremiobacteraeota bacterium]|nr:MAG: Antilisterial bacteriocin subtilosin biosynthesis protein AlbA [bacterium ADurb.Bin363]HPZ09233.1 radical SAM protein [Candidatus Eremiobacteraeota bacterium]
MEQSPYAVKKSIYEVKLWEGDKPLLSSLNIELTERCNNKCIHCYINLPKDDKEAQKKEMTGKEIKKILKEAALLGCMQIMFTGGEPLLREDFDELYIFTRKLGIKVFIFTNATLIDEKRAELFSKIPPGEKIEITIYGMKKRSYEAVTRNPGSFESAMKGVNLLLQKKVPFVVKGAILPQNKEEIEEFEEWAKTIPWMDKPPGYAMFFDLRGRRDKQKDLIKKVRLSPQEGLDIITRKRKEYIKEMKEFCGKFMKPSGDKIFSCGAGTGGGTVDSYGKFQLCMLLRHPDTVYDLKKGSLKDGIENFFVKIREIKATNSDYLNRCGKCFLKGLCEQCPGKSWSEHGSLDTPVEYLCEIAHKQAEFLGLLEEGEKAWEVVEWKERLDRLTGKEKSDNSTLAVL